MSGLRARLLELRLLGEALRREAGVSEWREVVRLLVRHRGRWERRAGWREPGLLLLERVRWRLLLGRRSRTAKHLGLDLLERQRDRKSVV